MDNKGNKIWRGAVRRPHNTSQKRDVINYRVFLPIVNHNNKKYFERKKALRCMSHL